MHPGPGQGNRDPGGQSKPDTPRDALADEAEGDGPPRTADEFELATLSWVHWFDENRLHSSIGYFTPVEKENEYYREIDPQSQPALGEPALHQARGDSLSAPRLKGQRVTKVTVTETLIELCNAAQIDVLGRASIVAHARPNAGP